MSNTMIQDEEYIEATSNMTIENLARQGRATIPNTLAGIDTKKLKQMRNAGLRSCFEHFNERHFRMQYEASIHGKTFINDAAARNINSTWYTMENYAGTVIWIARGNAETADYSRLRASALQKIRALYCLGDDENLRRNFDGMIPTIEHVESMREAVEKAFYHPCENATIIYSPSIDDGSDLNVDGMSFHYEVNEL